MTVFGDYSRYYNLLYKDKDYAGEVDYLHGLIGEYHPSARSILDLGCGTGRHDLLLAEKGYQVTGVDRSEEMLAVARSKGGGVTFHSGDVRDVRLGESFDLVVSLFHVVSYQTGNDDLTATFATLAEHLKPGGICIFDCWYGPAVLNTRPEVRVKRLEDEEVEVTRIADPVMHPHRNVVDVNYEIMIRSKESGLCDILRETHSMRYLFGPEVERLMLDAGLQPVDAFEWVTGKEPGLDSWGVCFVGRK